MAKAKVKRPNPVAKNFWKFNRPQVVPNKKKESKLNPKIELT